MHINMLTKVILSRINAHFDCNMEDIYWPNLLRDLVTEQPRKTIDYDRQERFFMLSVFDYANRENRGNIETDSYTENVCKYLSMYIV